MEKKIAYIITLVLAGVFIFSFYSIPQFLVVLLLFLLLFLPLILILSRMK